MPYFSLLNLALILGATLRLTRLVTTDKITKPLRDRLPASVREFAACSWCVGFWVALGVALWSYYDHCRAPWAFAVPALVLSLSWITGIAFSWLDSPPPARTVYNFHTNTPPPPAPPTAPAVPAPSSTDGQ